MQWKRTTWVALLLLAATPAVRATGLAPGATNVIPNTATLDNTTLLGFTTVNYNVGGTTVQLVNAAYRSNVAYVGLPAGTLIFTYSFTNTGTTTLSPLVSTSGLFGLLSIDVSSLDFAGFTRVDRSADGNTVTFRNFAPAIDSNLSPGETSPLLVLRTSAFGDAGLIGNTTLNGSLGSGATFAPLAIVPEPGSFALALVGLPLAVGCYRKWRRRQPA